MKKLTVIAQISLDGFVAGPKGEFDGFIEDVEGLRFVCSLTDEADTALFGRISYQLLDAYWPTAVNLPNATPDEKYYSEWYNLVPKYVLSKTLSDVYNASIISDEVVDEVKKLKQEEGNQIFIFGSPTAVHYLRQQNLIDSYWILIHPVFFGQGIPLFRDVTDRTSLKLTATQHFDSGMIGLRYEVGEQNG